MKVNNYTEFILHSEFKRKQANNQLDLLSIFSCSLEKIIIIRYLLTSIFFVISFSVVAQQVNPNPRVAKIIPDNEISYTNPIIPGSYPDPSICRNGEDYYLVNSSFNYFPAIPIFHSRDLIHWKQIGHALTRPKQVLGGLSSQRHHDGLWASTIRCHNGRFYVVTHNHRGTEGAFYVYTDDPTGEWTDPIYFDVTHIDPDLFFDKDGRAYLTMSNNILYEIDIKTGKILKGPKTIWEGMKELKHDEGPHLYFHDGWYYILQGEGGMDNPEHCVTIARSREIWGPYESCPNNPILSHLKVPKSPIQNTGHGDLVQAHDGSWWMVFLGIRPPQHDPTDRNRTVIGRETFLAPVTWSDDGWPVVNNNQPITLKMKAPLFAWKPFPPEPARDNFDVKTLAFQWNYYRLQVTKNYSLTEKPGFLRLRGSKQTLANPTGGQTFLGRRQQHRNFVAAAKLEFDPRNESDEAGLTLYEEPDRHCVVAVRRLEGARKVIVRQTLKNESITIASETVTDGPVVLEIRGTSETYQLGYQKNGTFHGIASLETRPYSYGYCVGNYIGMYATGNGSESQTQADFDWFDYKVEADENKTTKSKHWQSGNISMVNQDKSAVPKPVGLIVKNNVNWESFLGRHDMVWNRLPKQWTEGAFIGNGRLGAMIYKGESEAEPGADVLAWTIGRSDVYDERDPTYKPNNWTAHTRVPIGRFHIIPEGKVIDGDIRVVLWDGEAKGTIRTDRGDIRWRSWVPDADASSGVVVVDVDADEGEAGVTWKWQPFRSICPRYHQTSIPADYKPNPPGHQKMVGAVNVWVQPFLVGGDYATAWQTVSLSKTRQILYIAVGYGLYKGGSAERAASAVEAAVRKGHDVLQRENREWWHNYYQRSFLSIPDGRTEGHYWIQMYKLASATRPGGIIVDTCGPWLKVDTGWPATWWNLNVQLFHYPVPIANQLALNKPLLRLIKQEFENGNLIKNAPIEMRHNSAYFGNPTTVHNMINDDVYWTGKNITGRTRAGARLNHLPWVCHTMWEHYRRNMDDKFLKETLFPLTRRAYNFIFHFLEEDNDGRIHIKDVFSSEYGAADDANEAIAMINWGCSTLLWMADRLKVNDPDIPRWKDILARVVDPPVDENGLMIGSDVSFEKPHRHYSHLMSLVPFRTWDFEDEQARELAYHSINYFLKTRKGKAGYSYTGASSMYAMLGDGDRAFEVLKQYQEYFDKPNTMYTEGINPVMETPPSAARCVQDMLLQSHDVIHIFPAVPTTWCDASFDRLLAEGAFEVSAVRRNGSTQFIRIRSLAGESCRVRTNLDDPVRLTAKGVVPVPVDKSGILTLDLVANEEAVLVNKGYSGDLSIDQVEIAPQDCNYYGLKK